MQDHYDVMKAFDGKITTGDTARLHYPLREAFRKANMKGQQITTAERLKAFLAPWAWAVICDAMGGEEAALAA
jgi:hypothetical protein